MILCENCHQNVATVHLTEIIDKQKKEIHLCNECAKDKGISLKPFFVLNDVLGSLAGEEPSSDDELTCPDCGIKYSEFRQNGRLGCHRDYEHFARQLRPFMEKVHNSLFHSGKVPMDSREQMVEAQALVRLRRALKEAVEQERYEEAAKLRDELREKENQQSS